LTTNCVLLQEINRSVLEGDEPSTAVAEEEAAPPAEESAPASQSVPEAPATEAVLPEASVVEGKYSAEAVVLLEE
jgi:hypothetical protein